MQGKLPALTYPQLNWIAGQTYEKTLDEYAKNGRKVAPYRYFSVVTAFQGWQVVRYVLAHSEMSRNGYKFCFISEVSQRWMRYDSGLHLAIFEKSYVMNGVWHVHPYAISTPLSLKSWSSTYNRRGITEMCMGDNEVYPQRRFSQEFIDAGLTKYLGRYDEIWLYEDVRGNNLNGRVRDTLDKTEVSPLTMKGYLPTPIETCIKIGETELAYSCLQCYDGLSAQYLTRYWPSFVIARRHGLKNLSLADWQMWLEYVRDLDDIGKDIRSPKYLVPDDIGAAHAKICNKAFDARMARYEEQERLKRERKMQRDENYRRQVLDLEERKRRQEEREEKGYRTRMGAYLGLAFVTKSGLTITPLQSISAFKDEGKAMHHCVFTNGYYKKDTCLILSARDAEGKRVETIEIDLVNLRVAQSRAVCNGTSKYHNEIVSAMKDSMAMIREIVEDRNKKKAVLEAQRRAKATTIVRAIRNVA